MKKKVKVFLKRFDLVVDSIIGFNPKVFFFQEKHLLDFSSRHFMLSWFMLTFAYCYQIYDDWKKSFHQTLQKNVFCYCYHSVKVISNGWTHSDHI